MKYRITSRWRKNVHIAPLMSALHENQSLLRLYRLYRLSILQSVARERRDLYTALELINSSTEEKINEFDFQLALHGLSHILESESGTALILYRSVWSLRSQTLGRGGGHEIISNWCFLLQKTTQKCPLHGILCSCATVLPRLQRKGKDLFDPGWYDSLMRGVERMHVLSGSGE